MKVLFSGGGTLGPVTPLLAIHDVIKVAYPKAEYIWVGTPYGPERQLVEERGIPFRTIAAGKLRRYVSFINLLDPMRFLIGFVQSLLLLRRERPTFCISAGGYVSVPLHFAAWLLGIPTWVHQQDVRVGLSNRLMAMIAAIVTTALQTHAGSLPKDKTQWLGNPVRAEIAAGDLEYAREIFDLRDDLPVVLAMGGGTGSKRINDLVAEALPQLAALTNIIHVSGADRPQEVLQGLSAQYDTYRVYPFLMRELKHAYAAADIVISRGGFGSLTEIAALQKPAIVIPKPGHQDENVEFLASAGAVVLLDQRTASGAELAGLIRELLADNERRRQLGEKMGALLPRAEEKKILEILARLCPTPPSVSASLGTRG